MFSRILVKLIDQSIVPAVFLLATRVVSVILVSRYLNIDFYLTEAGFTFAKPEEYITINSYSTFFMVVALTVGLLYILVKAWIFHSSHISPETTAKLFSMNLSSFIQTSFDVYSQGAIWLSYLLLLVLVSGILALFGLLYPWVFYVSAALSIISTVLLILDVEKEIDIKRNTAYLDEDVSFLEKEELGE